MFFREGTQYLQIIAQQGKGDRCGRKNRSKEGTIVPFHHDACASSEHAGGRPEDS